MNILAQNDPVPTLFGRVSPPAGMAQFSDPVTGIGKLFALGIRLFILLAGLMLLLYLLWGAFDWIISGGDKERVAKAQSKITNAVIGMFMVIVSLTIFGVVSGNILGIIKKDASGGWIFNIPTLGGQR